MHVIGFRVPLQSFTGGGQKIAIYVKIFGKVLKWWLTVPQWKGIWEIS